MNNGIPLLREQLMAILRITMPTVRSWTRQGKLGNARFDGKRYLYDSREVRAAIVANALKVSPTALQDLDALEVALANCAN